MSVHQPVACQALSLSGFKSTQPSVDIPFVDLQRTIFFTPPSPPSEELIITSLLEQLSLLEELNPPVLFLVQTT